MIRNCIFLLVLLLCYHISNAQFLMDMADTAKEKGLLSINKKLHYIQLSGYIQPQFQAAQSKGVKNYAGGDFGANVNNRFMFRRSRIKIDYVHFTKEKGPLLQFAFQIDGTERGIAMRDLWGRIFENKLDVFSLTVGMFARPFSYELNLSSSNREAPERGRMSQILMKTERDLGAMVSFEPRKKNHPLRYLKIDAGLFNGQGLAASADYDSHKDFISRVALKPYPVTKKIKLSAGISYLNGGFLQNTKYIFTTGNNSFGKTFIVDSSASNTGKIAPRKYYGADVQVKFTHKYGATELRAEYMFGTQTATLNSSETPPALLFGNNGYYIRKFNGAYFCFLQNIVNTHHQIVLKYDWYDPNSKVKKDDIGKAGTALNATDIKYSTLGIGYIYYLNDNLRFVFWYDKITNEKTQLPGYLTDLKDNIFTCRLHFSF